ncbi:AAA family ATPase [Bacillus timonensis]|nr:AAA family ATPase [Bacillus timonensis]
MSVTWYFYSDTNARADQLEAILQQRNEKLHSIQRLEGLFTRLEHTPFAVLFIKAHTVYNVYELCQEIYVRYPHVYIILMAPDNMENVRKAMQVGASNVLRYSSENEEVTEVINHAQRVMYQRLKQEEKPLINLLKKNSRVISVCSPKGGIGRTLLTVNLAAACIKQGQKVAIVDANLQFGDVAMLLDSKPKQTIYEWVKEGFERGFFSIEKYLTKHETGIAILAAPPRPEFFEMISEEHIETVIKELKKYYDVVLIDTAPYLSDVHLKSLVESDELLLVTSSDLPTLRSSKLYIDTLQSLNLHEKVKVILNRDSRQKPVDTKKIEEVLQNPIFSILPDQDQVARSSINEGIPFVIKNARLPLSKSVLLLAKKLLHLRPQSLEEQLKPKTKRKFLMSK